MLELQELQQFMKSFIFFMKTHPFLTTQMLMTVIYSLIHRKHLWILYKICFSSFQTSSFWNPQKPDSDLSFPEAQILNLVSKHPQLPVYIPDKTLLPKLEFLYSKMFEAMMLPKLYHPT